MENKIDKAKKAYSEIIKVLKKHKDICVFNIDELETKSKLHLFGIELKEKYGFNIDPKNINSFDSVDLGQHVKIFKMGEKYNRTISWPDDGRQPEDELLLKISFPTGAYIFGEDAPVELFRKLFEELKTYIPKYLDTPNKSFYFSLENGGKVFNDFKGIMEKYHKLNKEEVNQRKIKKLEAELDKLKNLK